MILAMTVFRDQLAAGGRPAHLPHGGGPRQLLD
jgi:hypothetical protein